MIFFYSYLHDAIVINSFECMNEWRGGTIYHQNLPFKIR